MFHSELGSQRPNELIMVTILLLLPFKEENQCQGGIVIKRKMIFATTGPSQVKLNPIKHIPFKILSFQPIIFVTICITLIIYIGFARRHIL